MQIYYHPSADSIDKKLAYLYVILERLRLDYNEHGRQFRESEITEGEWNEYKNNWWRPRQQLTTNEMMTIRNEIYLDDTFGFTIDDFFDGESIDYPPGVSGARKRSAFLYVVAHLLALQWKEERNKFLNEEITQEEWDTFDAIWRVRDELVGTDLLLYRAELKVDSLFSGLDFDDFFVED